MQPSGLKRDMVGYANKPPQFTWPGGAKVAVQFVLNYEEGGENCTLNGDSGSETYISEIPGVEKVINGRNEVMESLYEYGSRSGFWRLHHLFKTTKTPLTVFAVTSALEQNPSASMKMKELEESGEWEIATHSYRWIDYNTSPNPEADDIKKAFEKHTEILGRPPRGFYCGRVSSNTFDLSTDLGKSHLTYNSDSYADDIPYFRLNSEGDKILVIPYSLDCNDMKFANNYFTTANDFFTYLKDSVDSLILEANEGCGCKMMSIGLHCRIIGRPGRVKGLRDFINYLKTLGDDVWVCRRVDIADFWKENNL